jgi:hypothetical protein
MKRQCQYGDSVAVVDGSAGVLNVDGNGVLNVVGNGNANGD